MEKLNWQTLEKLRSLFLDEKEGIRGKDYWDSEESLDLYDQTFAQRIGWKWQAVLQELLYKAGSQFPENMIILDWGCGTGIASRALLSHFPDAKCTVHVHDRSAKASRFALQKIRSEFPQAQSQIWDKKLEANILLLSHVLNEVDEKTLEDIKRLVHKSQITIWVEPGTHEISHKLIQVREGLRSTHQILAPCPHQEACPMMKAENQKHWCHNFAEPPADVFHSGFWRQFSRTLKIDLRSLSTSFLVLSKGGVPMRSEGDRILGRSKTLKSHVELITCNEDIRIEERKFTKRSHPEEYKRLSETGFYQTLNSR